MIEENNNEFELEKQLVIISTPTIKKLLSFGTIGRDALLLYMFYYYTAKWQKTNQPRATAQFCMKGLYWGEERFSKADKLLKDLNLVSKVSKKNEKGQIESWYVKINYFWTAKKERKIEPKLSNEPSQSQPLTVDSQSQNKAREIKPEPLETTPVVSPGSGFQDTNALSVSNRNALSVNNNKINGDSQESPSIQSLKRKEFKVKPEEYKEITDAYQRYKGIELSGAEFGEVKRAIKTMLYSGRTKENIIAFMRFCSDVCQAIKEGDKDIEKRLGWLQDWTMLTIKRKMPEFLAGKFKKVDDDETLEHIPEIARSWLK